jgi:hypothetical protein
MCSTEEGHYYVQRDGQWVCVKCNHTKEPTK